MKLGPVILFVATYLWALSKYWIMLWQQALNKISCQAEKQKLAEAQVSRGHSQEKKTWPMGKRIDDFLNRHPIGVYFALAACYTPIYFILRRLFLSETVLDSAQESLTATAAPLLLAAGENASLCYHMKQKFNEHCQISVDNNYNLSAAPPATASVKRKSAKRH